MTYDKLIKAIPALTEIKKLRLPYQKARDIYRLSGQFDDSFGFFVQEQTKIAEDLAIRDKDGKFIFKEEGVIQFKDLSDKLEYDRRIDGLKNTETGFSPSPVELSESEIGEQHISPEVISRLENIVIFN
jgi:hypothetical protein